MPARKKTDLAPRRQAQPGRQDKMRPRPEADARHYRAAGKLEGKKALVTGGDSGIGRAVAIAFAKEGADVAIVFRDARERQDAADTERYVSEAGRRCLVIRGDVGNPTFCQKTVEKVVQKLGGLDILVNNAGEQHVQEKFEDISGEQLERTFRTNIFSMFYLTKAALRHLRKGATIINTASVTAYRGKAQLVDYSSTKGAIVSFTRSLAQALAERGIRVNGVAPGPIWTPLIPATFDKKQIKEFGKHTLLGRPGHPDEVAPSYVFLASEDSSYMTGQFLHPNGGEAVGG
jgi:NAD(P)-dependent dehydrogenase (short-subunit alcohol dehydrogenase family)